MLSIFQSSQNNTEKYQRFQIDIFDTQDQMVLVQDEGKIFYIPPQKFS